MRELLESGFKEKNALPDGYPQEEYESKCLFYKWGQDFLLRGKPVFLTVLWTSHSSNMYKFNQLITGPISKKIYNFNTASEAVLIPFERILTFFNNRSSYAHAESLKAQIKLFGANITGVSNTKLFLYRLQKIFAEIRFLL